MTECEINENAKGVVSGQPLTKAIVLEELEHLSGETKGGRPVITVADEGEVGNWFLFFIPVAIGTEFLFDNESPTKINIQIHLDDGGTLGMIDFGKTKQVSQITKRFEQLGFRSGTLFRVHLQTALHRWLNLSSTSGLPIRQHRCVIHEYYAEGVRHRCDWVTYSHSHSSAESIAKMETMPHVDQVKPLKRIKVDAEYSASPPITSEYQSVITTRMISDLLPRRSISKEDVVVYVDGFFDLSNISHVLTLRNARELGTYLIVGIPNEHCQNITAHVLTLSACRFVDDIVMGAPRVINDNLVRSLGIHVIATTSTTETAVMSPSTKIVPLRCG